MTAVALLPLVTVTLTVAERDGRLFAELDWLNASTSVSFFLFHPPGLPQEHEYSFFRVSDGRHELEFRPYMYTDFAGDLPREYFLEIKPRGKLRTVMPISRYAWRPETVVYRIQFHRRVLAKPELGVQNIAAYVESNEVRVRYRPSGEEWELAGVHNRSLGRPWPATEPKPVPVARKAAVDRAEAADAKKRPVVPPKPTPPAAKPPAKPAQPPPQPQRQGRVLTPEELRAERLEEERARNRAAAAALQQRVAAAKRPR